MRAVGATFCFASGVGFLGAFPFTSFRTFADASWVFALSCLGLGAASCLFVGGICRPLEVGVLAGSFVGGGVCLLLGGDGRLGRAFRSCGGA